MLTRLWLRNFKSWPELDIEFKPITLLYGANSSGKSSIIQFLLLLKQTKDSNDPQVALDFGAEDKLVDLGSFRDAVYQHDPAKPLSWALDWRPEKALTVYDPAKVPAAAIATGGQITLEAEVVARGRQVMIDNLSYSLGDASFYIYRKAGKPKYQLESMHDNFRFIRTLG
jgi:hypothetical protein